MDPKTEEKKNTIEGEDADGKYSESSWSASDDAPPIATPMTPVTSKASAALRSPIGSPRNLRLEQLERKEAAKREREHTRFLQHQRQAKLKMVREEQNRSIAADTEHAKASRLQFLVNQAEIYSHFMGGREAKQAERKGSDHQRNRMTEVDQDQELMDEVEEHQTIAILTVQPACISGKMRDYQLHGLNWLLRRYETGINSILADEMGLGKTLQTIALLGYLKNALGVQGPHLVIAPKSTIGNWMREIASWCPSLRAIRFLGNKDERAEIVDGMLLPGKFDICVTSYEIAVIEKAALKKFAWRYLVVDEAHRIKNEKSVLSVVVRLFRSQFRLLLTGTPLQNNLHELWALLNFLLPDVFSDVDDFLTWFDFEKEEAEEKKTETIQQLHKVLRPFLLRRLKADVEKGLPPKKETALFVSMSQMQKTWYKNILSRNIDAINGSKIGGAQTRLLNILMQLRKVCNHPYMFDGAEPGPPFEEGEHLIENCGKMVLLDKLLTRLQARGHRVLVFSQMTRMLDILDDYCHYRGYEYCRIDGQTAADDRETQIDDFNSPGSKKFLFLLSTRAGGLGINLATADTVIIYDSDWNPQVDLQAMDRCHRIGQKKEVKVYRLVVDPSIETKIVERAEKKLRLDALVIQSGRLVENKSLSKTEMLSMIRHGADAVFHANTEDVTDEDIEALLARGEEKTREMTKTMEEIAKDRFELAVDTGVSMYEFEGTDYRDKGKGVEIGGLPQLPPYWVELEKRERKQGGYSEAQYYRSLTAPAGGAVSKPRPKQPKQPASWDFQFYDRRIGEIFDIEYTHYAKMLKLYHDDKYDPEKDTGALTAELQEEKQTLMETGFIDWSRRDFNAFVRACATHGRSEIDDIVKSVEGKTEKEVKRYYDVFWSRYKELSEYERIIGNIEKGEQRLLRQEEMKEAIAIKYARHRNPWETLEFAYGSNAGRGYSEEEDRFLFCMIHQLGYGEWESLKKAVSKAWELRFDWWIKSRTAQELGRRCDTLIRLAEKENEEIEEEERERDRHRRALDRKKKQEEEARRREIDQRRVGAAKQAVREREELMKKGTKRERSTHDKSDRKKR